METRTKSSAARPSMFRKSLSVRSLSSQSNALVKQKGAFTAEGSKRIEPSSEINRIGISEQGFSCQRETEKRSVTRPPNYEGSLAGNKTTTSRRSFLRKNMYAHSQSATNLFPKKKSFQRSSSCRSVVSKQTKSSDCVMKAKLRSTRGTYGTGEQQNSIGKQSKGDVRNASKTMLDRPSHLQGDSGLPKSTALAMPAILIETSDVGEEGTDLGDSFFQCVGNEGSTKDCMERESRYSTVAPVTAFSDHNKPIPETKMRKMLKKALSINWTRNLAPKQQGPAEDEKNTEAAHANPKSESRKKCPPQTSTSRRPHLRKSSSVRARKEKSFAAIILGNEELSTKPSQLFPSKPRSLTQRRQHQNQSDARRQVSVNSGYDSFKKLPSTPHLTSFRESDLTLPVSDRMGSKLSESGKTKPSREPSTDDLLQITPAGEARTALMRRPKGKRFFQLNQMPNESDLCTTSRTGGVHVNIEVICQLCDQEGHSAKHCFLLHPFKAKPMGPATVSDLHGEAENATPEILRFAAEDAVKNQQSADTKTSRGRTKRKTRHLGQPLPGYDSPPQMSVELGILQQGLKKESSERPDSEKLSLGKDIVYQPVHESDTTVFLTPPLRRPTGEHLSEMYEWQQAFLPR